MGLRENSFRIHQDCSVIREADTKFKKMMWAAIPIDLIILKI